MQQATVLFGPIVEVRDVLESFRHDHVLVADWRQRLTDASQQFVDLSNHMADPRRFAELGDRVARLAAADLASSPLTNSVAAEVEHLLDEVTVPGRPGPENEDWTF